MKPLILAYALLSVGIAHGQVVEVDRALLAREFKNDAPKVLDHPFIGMLQVVWPRDKKNDKQERVRLNLLNPADSGKGYSPINTPYLASSEDGESYWGAFALREKLPSTKDLISFSTYKEIVDLLGPPTQLPFSGETDDKWAYDTVSWCLFAPLSAGSIEILRITVARKSPLGGVRDGGYLVASYSVSRGRLTKSAQGGAVQPAPKSKSEGKENPKPKSEGSDKDGEKVCKLHHQPLKSVSGYLPDSDLMVDPGYGVTEFKSQFGDRYPHIAPWYFSPEKREDWNEETTIEVCEECVKICSRDFAAYMKIDEKVRWDQYVEFLGKKGRRERDSVSPVVDGNGTDIDPDSSKPSEELHLPPDLPPP